jgi:hypothetical protein
MAAIKTADGDGGGYEFADGAAAGRREAIEPGTACNCCWEMEGTGAGATGEEGAFGAAQQGKLQQGRALQHVFAAGARPHEATIG